MKSDKDVIDHNFIGDVMNLGGINGLLEKAKLELILLKHTETSD